MASSSSSSASAIKGKHSALNKGAHLKRGTMIIQCPSCQTKFALEASSFEHIDEPRFHCSRCDHVFTMEQCRKPLSSVSEGYSGSRSPDDQSQWERPAKSGARSMALDIPQTFEPSFSTTAPHEGETHSFQRHSSQQEFRESESRAHVPAPVQMELGLGHVGSSGPEPAYDVHEDDYQLPDASESHQQFSGEQFLEEGAHPEACRLADLKDSLPESSLEKIGAPATEKNPASAVTETLEIPERDLEDMYAKEAGPFPSLNSGILPENSVQNTAQSRPQSRSLSIPELKTFPSARISGGSILGSETDVRGSEFGAPGSSATSGKAKIHTGWRSLSLAALPFLIFLAILGAISFYAASDTQTTAAVMERVFPSAPRVAPPGLYVKNSRFRSVVLDSGDRVFVISGRVSNESEDNFSDVTMEGLLFSESSELLARARASLFSPLGKGKIKSLTPELIQSTQAASAPQGSALKNGEEVNFAIVLSDDNTTASKLLSEAYEGGEVNFFTARILSVR